MAANVKSYQSVEAAERAERAQSEAELRHAINNHAENLENVNTGYTEMFKLVTKQAEQIDVLLDSVHQLTARVAVLEQARG